MKYQIILAFVFIACLAFLFPYSGDDWAWGSSIGLERLSSGFANYNGRYLGNILVILLTRSNLLKSVIVSITVVGIAYGSMRFINKENKIIFWLVLAFICLMPTTVLSQGLVWTSGFTNYAVPTLFIIVYMNIFKDIEQEDYMQRNWMPVLTFVLGVSNALIMENISLYNVFISFIFIIYTYYKHKKIDIAQVTFFIGALLGTGIMFSNGAYANIASNQDGYRAIAQEGNIVINAFHLYFNKVYTLFSFQNVLLNSTIIYYVLKFVEKLLNNVKLKKISNYFLNVSRMYLILFFIYSIIKTINPKWNILLKYTKYFEGLIVIGFCIIIFIITLYGVKKNLNMKKALYCEVSIVVLLAPLFIVNPIGPRNFLPIYCLFIVLLLCFFDLEKNDFKIKQFIILLFVTSYVYLLSVYSHVYKASIERIDYINERIGVEDTIEIKSLPYSNYIWFPDPKEKLWNERFKLFYNIPEEFEIIVKHK